MDEERDNPGPTTCPGCAERDRRIARLAARAADLEARVAALEQKLAESLRAGKRQAGPFSKGPPKPDPRKPGRKSGEGYGTHARRPAPDPARVTESYDAPLPGCCPDPACGGDVTATGVARQYQVEIPRTPVYRRFDVQVGCCAKCGRRVQGRHPLQTSDALGCCASQLGPNVQAAAVYLNKHAGLSHGKVAGLFSSLFDIDLTAGAVSHTILRAARRCGPDYQQILARLRSSPWAVCDETGWRVGGRPAWLHAAACPDAVAYCVAESRGLEATARLVGAGYAGDMVHDGWKPYFGFEEARHQLCNGHLLRRCKELEERAAGGAAPAGGAARFPRRVKALLKEGLAVRDRRDAGGLSAAAAAAAGRALEPRLSELIVPRQRDKPNETFANHLYEHQTEVFTYLKLPRVAPAPEQAAVAQAAVPPLDATNYRAEQAIRPAVVNRKVWGGNRTGAGADAQGVLTSVIRTAFLHGRDVVRYLSETFRGLPGRAPLLPPPPPAGSPVPSG